MKPRLAASLALLAAGFAFHPVEVHAQQSLSARMDRGLGPEVVTAASGGAIANTKCSSSPGGLYPNYSQPTNTLYASVNGGATIPAHSKFYLEFAVDGGDTGSAEPTWKLGSTSGLALTKAVGTLATSNVEIWYGDTGASSYTDTIVFTGTANQYKRIAILCGYLTNAATGAPSTTSTMATGNYASSDSPVQTVVTVPTSPSAGIAVIAATLQDGTAGTPPYTLTWTNATQVDTGYTASVLNEIWNAQASTSATVSAANAALAYASGIASASWVHQ